MDSRCVVLLHSALGNNLTDGHFRLTHGDLTLGPFKGRSGCGTTSAILSLVGPTSMQCWALRSQLDPQTHLQRPVACCRRAHVGIIEPDAHPVEPPRLQLLQPRELLLRQGAGGLVDD
jgi:hypothetical protein